MEPARGQCCLSGLRWVEAYFSAPLALIQLSNAISLRQLIENANNSKRLAFEAAATLSGLLADYSQTEIRYLKMIPSTGAKASTKGLEDALVEAYTAILKYSAAVRKTTHGSRRGEFLFKQALFCSPKQSADFLFLKSE